MKYVINYSQLVDGFLMLWQRRITHSWIYGLGRNLYVYFNFKIDHLEYLFWIVILNRPFGIAYLEVLIWKSLFNNYAALQVDLEEEEGGYERVKNGQDDD